MIGATEISRMTVRERLRVIQQLWESIPSADSAVKSPAWHEKVLDSRKQKVVSGKAEFLSLEALRKRLLSE
jgi:putative addiction module component (TIGR02574 family)